MDRARFNIMPKAERHVHLEGSFKPHRALALAREAGDHPWAAFDQAALQRQLAYPDFPAFIQTFMDGYRLLKTRRHFQMVTEDLCEQLINQGVQLAQVLYSPGVYIQKLGVALGDIHAGIAAGIAHYPKLQTSWILDTVLNLGLLFMQQTLTAVLERRPAFLGGFSVGGGVPDLDMHAFLPLFEQAQKAGLMICAHVGEIDHFSNIKTLLAHTDLKRIAHGCNAVEDQALLKTLRERGVFIDVCLTSNRRTGVVADLKHHPIKQFWRANVPLTINTDDPFYFQTDLYQEYRLAAELLNLNESGWRQLATASLKATGGSVA